MTSDKFFLKRRVIIFPERCDFKTQGSSPVIFLTDIPKNPCSVFCATSTLNTLGSSENKGFGVGGEGDFLYQCLDKVERFALGPSSKPALATQEMSSAPYLYQLGIVLC